MAKTVWQPSASIETLHQRAQLLGQIRAFFAKRNVLEVETPMLASHGVSDAYLANFAVQIDKQTLYLQTSPEYHMKRLLAAGSGCIYQIAKAFRPDEQGKLHNREFTLLEWYRLGFDHHQLMAEVDELLQLTLNTTAAVKMTYRQVFEQYLGFNPLQVSLEELISCANEHQLGDVITDTCDSNQYLHLLMGCVIESQLAELKQVVMVYDFPKAQAALAKVEGDIAHRFEVYYQGIELANGFDELTCAKEQRRRFEQDNRLRTRLAMPEVALDEAFIAALAHGMPPSAGVALGLDRLIMLALKQNSIDKVLSFNALNA